MTESASPVLSCAQHSMYRSPTGGRFQLVILACSSAGPITKLSGSSSAKIAPSLVRRFKDGCTPSMLQRNKYKFYYYLTKNC